MRIVSDQSTFVSTCAEGGTIQWMSPELIDPPAFDLEKVCPTKASDCYALGMVIHEVLSGQTPFSPWRSPLIIKKVLEGERPGKPEGEGGALFTDGIWEILERCWKHWPEERTNAKVVLLCLEGTPPDGMGGTTETDTGEWQGITANNPSLFSLFHLGSLVHLQSPLRYNRSASYT